MPGLSPAASAQEETTNQIYDPALFEELAFRTVGPFRGGRSTAVTGIADQPTTFFMGTTGGGVWKTVDNGLNWINLSDGFFGGSIGAIDIANTDPSIIYVGTGSACIRGNTSHGHGAYKSMDGGKTWTFIGLPEAGQIGAIEVHPTNPDLVYVAALGHAFGKNPERGVFRSKDGGATWEHVLAVSDSTGAVSLSINPRNPREIYAGLWRAERKPWTLISGGTDGGVYKSMDGGDTWAKLGGGLPTGPVGKVGVAVSPANPERVWALIEAEPQGGLYRSDDAGKTWERINSENRLRQRAWYYTHVVADPQDEHTVYALNTGFYRSVDGGTTFTSYDVPHGDVHDLWINPNAPDVMVVANDGGAQVSVTGAESWSTYLNQPTAELYGVVVDNQFPYRLYGAQQDNTTISVPNWLSSNGLDPREAWFSVGGCETGRVALHPDNPETVYAGCYGGAMDRFDRTRSQVRNIMLYPQLQLGEAGHNLKHRFQWVSPILVSPHDPTVVYHGSQYVNRTRDGGMTWETISPDLTTNNPVHQDYSGGPINHDITGVEIFNTVFTLAESPQTPGVLWAGTDDGRLHLSRDGGATWSDVTPDGLPALGTVNNIDLSTHQDGRALVAVQRYRLDDFAPYIFQTDDFGASWTLLTDGTNGLPADHPVRVVREDPVRRGLLYAGTEYGLFVSFDDGAHWQSIQNNLPVTPVTDLRIQHQDLILSTQGRSFWILDDITPLHQLTEQVAAAEAYLFRPRDTYRVDDRNSGGPLSPGAATPQPAPDGTLIRYYLADSVAAEVTLDVLDDQGGLVRSFSSDSSKAEEADTPLISTGAGLHTVTWNLTYPGPDLVEDAVLWGFTGGVKAPPGSYQVRLTVDGQTQTQTFNVLKDPRLDDVTQQDFEAQFDLALQVRDALNDVENALRNIIGIEEQLSWITERVKDLGEGDDLAAQAEEIAEKLTAVKEKLMQTRNRSNQDPIRFPPRLDNQYIELYNYVTGVDGYISGGPEGRPTQGAYMRFEDLQSEWTPIRNELQTILETDVSTFNDAFERLDIPAITTPADSQ